uniref:ABC transporter domain-containing protein n=1 Tax=Steinernema glaseri TaxID=37863 RepID=A0A1I7Z5C4_9BILA
MPIAGPNSGAELRLPPWSRLLELNVCIPIIAYFIAFHLLAFVVRRNTWMTFDGFKQYRLRNLTVCLFHSTVTGCWALSFLLLYPDIMFHHTIHWYEPFAAHLPMISIGYFCYDATDMLRHEISRWTLELLLHHVACVFVFLMAVLPQKFLPYATWALLMEINSIFLHIRSIMQLSGEAERNADKYKLSQAANIITLHGDVALRDVHFVYPSRPERPVLQGIQLGTQAGKSLAIVGPSGCGKSTIMGLIARLYDPRDGRVEFDAFDARTMHVKTLRGQMATVSQEPVLFDTTIRENIAYGCDLVGLERIQQAAREANIHETILSLPQGYETRVGEQGSQLSGGQKQRIAIARAIVRDPRILLLDEATSALDSESERKQRIAIARAIVRDPRILLLDEATSALDSESERVVQAALEKAAAGRTCIAIAHRLSSIQNYDTIVVVKHGRVMESGSHEELLEARGLYYSMVKKQKIS